VSGKGFNPEGWPMRAVLNSLPLVAAILAVPQFLPQLVRLQRRGDAPGVSWSWAALTSVNNAAWLGYFALFGFWTALVPAARVLAFLRSRSPTDGRSSGIGNVDLRARGG
jgi:uncharacterized protein with PQ loop repeat